MKKTLDVVTRVFEESVRIREHMLNDQQFTAALDAIVAQCVLSLRQGRKILFCGNGGSAADAQHLSAELSGRFAFDRAPLPAEALHVNTSYLTAVANDYSFDEVYARLVQGTGVEGDVIIALSTSGNSPNIIRALQKAGEIGMIRIGMSGMTGGAMKEHCDYLIAVPSEITARIQEVHITIGHMICELIEENIFKAPA